MVDVWSLTCRGCHKTFKLEGNITDLAEDRNCPSCDLKTTIEWNGPPGEHDYTATYWFLSDVGLDHGG